jgi:hypothetical protein
MEFVYKKDVLKRFDDYSRKEQLLITAAEREIRHYYETHQAPYGLRIKKLFGKAQQKIFEARVSDKIRFLWVESEGHVYFSFLGSHDEVRRFIRSFQ